MATSPSSLIPFADNSGFGVSVSSAPALDGGRTKFRLGRTRVRIKARDASGNVAKCAFRVKVKGPSRIECLMGRGRSEFLLTLLVSEKTF